MNWKDIDVASICLLNKIRFDPVSNVAKCGNHILLEKSIDTFFSEANKISREIGKYKVRLMPAHILQFGPRYVCNGE